MCVYKTRNEAHFSQSQVSTNRNKYSFVIRANGVRSEETRGRIYDLEW